MQIQLTTIKYNLSQSSQQVHLTEVEDDIRTLTLTLQLPTSTYASKHLKMTPKKP